MSAGTCEGDPFADPRGLMCVAQADGRRTLGRDPVHQRMNDRGGEENCKAAANRLRKTRRVPAGRIPLSPLPARAKRRSNASFETKHRPPAVFPGSLSFTKRRLSNAILREQNRARRGSLKRQNLSADNATALAAANDQ